MPSENLPLLFLGLALAGALLSLGYFFGRRRRRVRVVNDGLIPPLVDEDDRQRIVGMLQSLARWTHEYSDNVSDYQSNLKQISQDVRRNLASAHNESQSSSRSAGEARAASDTRMLSMITQIMSTNEELQSRLDAAEKQLAEQTSQIESYLTEARTDGLTGLFNRRAFDKKLDEMFAEYRGGGGSFTLILVDIDHFKSINDTHGHPVGDVVLQRIASQLSNYLSDAEIVARFGGEEFAILTRSPLRNAAKQLNQLRIRIADEPIQAGNVAAVVTMSVGLSEPRDELVIGPIVRRTDAALYCAKNRGRNRVYFDDGSGPQLFGAPEVVRS
ncbi:diguanylate cyclase [Neorhodopirellula pilleata]|uniref:diguanylate cyclase n=1 Tax=Neorhodopirellula pilleata TaxID=2714738 RepID=A0A5C5ZR28_9BACT|nr:diguanylate cyclase [Neorhodopirellula pilleata]TWT89525.1 putative diguanylate cyclase YdaM [Neorhodopirellula pilleata]